MSVYNNLVYLSICDAAYDRFKKTNFLTFSNYCKNLSTSIALKNLSYKEQQDLYYIIDTIDKTYCMGHDETNQYIKDFLNLDNIFDYERCVRFEEEYYPNSKIYL